MAQTPDNNSPAVAKLNLAMDAILAKMASPEISNEGAADLTSIYERLQSRVSAIEFTVAMNAAQAEMTAISQDASNAQTRTKYATYGALDKVVRPIYTGHGFSISFDTTDMTHFVGDNGEEAGGKAFPRIMVRMKVSHTSGHSETYDIVVPSDGRGARGNSVMTETHATISAVSYGRRALLKMVFNIAEGDYDDDGNAASGGTGRSTGEALIAPAQLAELRAIISREKIDEIKIKQMFDVDSLDQLTAKDATSLRNMIEVRRANRAQTASQASE